jgi:hypothetical protein
VNEKIQYLMGVSMTEMLGEPMTADDHSPVFSCFYYPITERIVGAVLVLKCGYGRVVFLFSDSTMAI